MEIIAHRIMQRFPSYKDAFQFFDLDANGLITQPELQIGLEKLGLKIHRNDTSQIFNDLDHERRNCVDFKGFVKIFDKKINKNVISVPQIEYKLSNKKQNKKKLNSRQTVFQHTIDP